MKTPPCFRYSAGLLLGLTLALGGLAPARAADPVAVSSGYLTLTPEQLEQLLGPIALYPDALVALILPASTNPTEVVLAARYVNSGGDPTQVDLQPWSDPMKALARYPEVVKWMDENLEWTQQLGTAFQSQPDAVMDSIQRLRSRAVATGALVSTPQQKVVVEDGEIEIVPVQPDVIYIPRYDPEVVYDMPPPGYIYPYSTYLSFGVGYPAGAWLCFDFDWYHRTIWVGDRRHDWREHRDWRHHETSTARVTPSSSTWHAWHPPANRPLPPSDHRRPNSVIEHPRPLPGVPVAPRPPHRNEEPRPTHPEATIHRTPANIPSVQAPPHSDRPARTERPPAPVAKPVPAPVAVTPNPRTAPERPATVPNPPVRTFQPPAPPPVRTPPAPSNLPPAASRPAPQYNPPAHMVNPSTATTPPTRNKDPDAKDKPN